MIDASSSAGPLGELERELTRLFRRTRAASSSLVAEVHPELDATGYAVLQWLLDRPDGARATELGEALRLHKSNASRTLADLDRLGLVDRVIDPDDARARLVRLSEAGADAVTRARRHRRAAIADRLGGWADDDLHALALLLGRLNDDLG